MATLRLMQIDLQHKVAYQSILNHSYLILSTPEICRVNAITI